MLSTRQMFPNDLETRNKLLQDSHRPYTCEYGIEQEFPLVLDAQNYLSSFCAYSHSQELCGHLSLWPRRVLNSNKHSVALVGLIGNVATHPQFRKQGVMKKLLRYTEEVAIQKGYHAIVLWSDLVEFYQNLGFRCTGKEFRFLYRQNDFMPPSLVSTKRLEQDEISATLLRKLAKLRFQTKYTLERSLGEFLKLIRIPDTNLHVTFENNEPTSYLIIGKGQDFSGVIHEWGSIHPELILSAIHSTLSQSQLESLTLLTPSALDNEHQTAFQNHATSVSKHPMALTKILSYDPKVSGICDQLFIWGLDSI